MAVSFDLFGTLVAVDRPADPAAAVGRALADAGVALPDDWASAYGESRGSVPAGSERPLPDRVRAVLASRGVDVPPETVESAVRSAFVDGSTVTSREGARAAVASAAERGPVGVLSNCSVPGFVEAVLDRSTVDRARFDAVVTSVDCGWRKPDRRAFLAAAEALDCDPADLVHVGDDPVTDGGVTAVDGEFVFVDEARFADRSDAVGGRG
ncbi:MAG: HAD family hydrolase [Haloarculaceae archaeon]